MPSQALKGMTTQELFDLLQFADDQRGEMDTIIDGMKGPKK